MRPPLPSLFHAVVLGMLSAATGRGDSQLGAPAWLNAEAIDGDAESVERGFQSSDDPLALDADAAGDDGATDPEAETGTAEDDADDSEQEDAEPAQDELPPSLLSPRLHQFGPVTGEYVYTGEVFTNARGGLNTNDATEYRGNLDLMMVFDLAQVGGIHGGEFFLYGQEGHGRGITLDHVGDYQTVSNIDGRRILQVSEYWWMQSWGDGLVTTKLGKQDANADFCTLDAASSFIHCSFGLIPNVPLPVWPNPGVGGALFVEPSETVWLGAGVYDGTPDGRTWGWSRLGADGAFCIAEAVWRPALADGRLPGAYHAGSWYHSGDVDDLAEGDSHAGNYGAYFLGEQMVLNESGDPADDQGLGVFVQYGWAPPRYNAVPHYFGGGLLYKGPLAGRDEDYLGLGVAHAEFSDQMLLGSPAPVMAAVRGAPHLLMAPLASAGPTAETATELFYTVQLRPWLRLQPDLQYIANPSGDGRDAVAVGVRLEATL